MCLKAKFCAQIEGNPSYKRNVIGVPSYSTSLWASTFTVRHEQSLCAGSEQAASSASPQLSCHARLARGYLGSNQHQQAYTIRFVLY